MTELEHWDSFYLIVGSASGALVGIMFVVVTLISERRTHHAYEASMAFTTPTIVHFCAAFLACALARVPWHAITALATCWALLGFAGIGYCAIVARRMRMQRAYVPNRADWAFYFVVPFGGYALLVVSAFAAPSREHEGLFGVAAAILWLLFTGIRNAWDVTLYSGLRVGTPEEMP